MKKSQQKNTTSIITLSLGLALLSSCSQAPIQLQSPSGSGFREPASFCNPNDADDKAIADYLEMKETKLEKKRQIYMYGIVQSYVMGAELLKEFDDMLDDKVPLKEIYSSNTYAKLLALHQVKKDIRHALEQVYAAKIEKDLASAGIKSRKEAAAASIIAKNTEEAGNDMEEIIQNGPDDLYARLALEEVKEDFEDLKDYYTTCKWEVLYRNMERRIQERKNNREEFAKVAPPEKNAYKAWKPHFLESGINVGKKVKALAKDILKGQRALLLGRDPQAEPKFAPGVGKSGNIVGTEFPKGVWALTYDDGPAATTPKVIDNLKKHDMKATFYMLTQQLKNKAYLESAKRELAEGHDIASHSYSHVQMTKQGPEGLKKEIDQAVKDFETFLGKKPGSFRLPYGAGVSNATIRQKIAANGLVHVFWNVDTLDWQDKNPDSIYQRAVKQMAGYGRGVVLFHDIHPQSVIASEKLMGYLKDPANKIRTVTISEIMKEMNDAAAAVVPTPAP